MYIKKIRGSLSRSICVFTAMLTEQNLISKLYASIRVGSLEFGLKGNVAGFKDVI